MATRFHGRGIRGSELGRPFLRLLGSERGAEHWNAGLGTGLLSGRAGIPPLPRPAQQGGRAFQRVRQDPVPTPADFCCSNGLGLVQKVEQLSLGIFHPAFNPTEYIKRLLQRSLPPDVHILASQRLGISLTRWPEGDNVIVTEFASRDEVIQVSCWWAGPGALMGSISDWN